MFQYFKYMHHFFSFFFLTFCLQNQILAETKQEVTSYCFFFFLSFQLLPSDFNENKIFIINHFDFAQLRYFTTKPDAEIDE